MKRLPLGVVLGVALLGCGAARAEAASPIWPQPTQYSAHVRYAESHATLSGRERITFLNDGPDALSSVWLRVWPNGYGSCSRHLARVRVTGGGRAAGWAARCTALRVRLSSPLAAGASGAVNVRLRVKVPRNADRFGRAGGVVYLGNALPLLDVEGSSGPSLQPYSGLGDPFYSSVARWDVTLDIPRSLVAATTGSVTRRRRVAGGRKRLTIAADQARDFAIVLGHFAVSSATTAEGVRLVRYRHRGTRRSAARSALRVARGTVEQFSTWYGDPGESEIDMVPSPFRGGMEYPGLVMTPDSPRVITHELAHQWWYALVGNDEWHSPWLDESFAEFSARRLPRALYGRDGLRCKHNHPVKGPLTASMGHWEKAPRRYFNTVYIGGTCALRSLQADIGVNAMTAFLRSYVDAHRFGIVTRADFVEALRAAAPTGYDVDAFLRRAGIAG